VKQISKRLTYANVMSSIAVFMVLGGATAFAATKIGANEIKANSIKTGKIVKEAVTAGKIKNSAITTGKLANGAVVADKIADNAVTTAKIANEAVTGAKVAKNSITGANVNASTLGVVPEATVGSPRAYAYIGPGGTIRTDAPSGGITNANLTKPVAGTYCVNNLPFTPKTAQVSGDTFGDNDNIIGVLVGTRDDAQCPGSEQVAVQNFDLSSGVLSDDEFFLVIW
jgi:hypothetical protein